MLIIGEAMCVCGQGYMKNFYKFWCETKIALKN